MAFYGPGVQPTLSTQSARPMQPINATPPGLPMQSMQPGNAAPPGMPMQPGNAAGQPNYEGSGMNPANAYVDPTQRFAQDLLEMYGPDTANMILNNGMADQAYRSYVERGYRF